MKNIPIRYYSYETDIILDPFMGIGTTGLVAQNLHRDFIGMELDRCYYNIAKERLGIWSETMKR